MTVKINAQALGIKEPIEIKETNKNVRKTLMVQRDQAKLNDFPDDITDEKVFQARIDSLEIEENFVAEMLHLNKNQIEKMKNDVESKDVENLAVQILTKIQHIDIPTADQQESDEITDPKEKKPVSEEK